MNKYSLYFILLISIFATSCMSKKKFVYLQGNQSFKDVSVNYEPIIQNDDRLTIVVSSLETEAAQPFNWALPSEDIGYLVDNHGNIEFPVLGTLSVSGYSLTELKSMLKQKLTAYIKNPVINILISNFKVTVLGDVKSPGVKPFTNHRVTLLEALGAAGDLTIYAKRNNVLVVRDFQGIKSFNRVDITKADFVNSPFYYLDQNDVIYVEERKAKIDTTALPNLPVIISAVSFLITIAFLVTR
ncbi:polysaccharide biosynthesis/export family protein [Flavobacterium sp. SUN052]|uniref:polysaccharide biosynthesis/export family protein n=1 Tax=Flavobacterium sp. SUN052 TaxID=3002441 RepID=UPI00237D3989|nr:polysaccharide biosynthesis/export family protein [Flavobacterium sp. SUN052]MEC4004410.1 polysaccharide biosynthesis/export family protein [Flavobacterium sp. SUN052]